MRPGSRSQCCRLIAQSDLEKVLAMQTAPILRLAMDAAVNALDELGQASLNSDNCKGDLKTLEGSTPPA